MPPFLSLLFLLPLLALTTFVSALTLTLQVPTHIPALPSTTTAYLRTSGLILKAPVTRKNIFVFRNITRAEAGSYLLDIVCKDYDFLGYGVDVVVDKKGDGEEVDRPVVVEVYRVGRGGMEMGERVRVGEGGVEVRVLRAREYYEARSGFSPLSLLKNPMILMAIVGLAFVFGMPYLLENMDPEMKAEFEEQQKKSILSGGTSTPNPLQNFDMAAWMAGKTAGSAEQSQDEGTGTGSSSGPRARRRG
ncbi:hypothetical protein JMJ35_009171 [Cladonia borealis]|uniref:ER membrane protein complex subunit 7 beta-sandwich domain-containing protein n=1 Tax=Cladonia borealis TaxID=184061 RepID=A0AA39QRZ3_9LECA|nr:hypothetical protein JMJ35_009171 [Cladonia borealis]